MNDASSQRPVVRRRRGRVQVDIEVLTILEQVLNLRGRSRSFTLQTPLLGSLPELDSMAVVSVITALEERFGFAVADDEIDGSTFATVGDLVAFVDGKRRGA
jgi:acyl carrier protein